MSNNKQSSIEWFKKELEDYGTSERVKIDWKTFDELFEQAKAMEKKQCVDFALKCMLNGLEPHKSTREAVEKIYEGL